MSLRILQTSDLHLGITDKLTIEKMLDQTVQEKPDILVMCGDYSGDLKGSSPVVRLSELFREYFPRIPIISVLGNHDLWHYSKSLEQFNKNYTQIISSFSKHSIRFLDIEGPILLRRKGQRYWFIGHTGWYAVPYPETNDCNFLPIGIEGDTNAWLLKQADFALEKQMIKLDNKYREGDTVIFISHFSVCNTGRDWKGRWADFNWHPYYQELIQTKYNCNYFLQGHRHEYEKGPIVYECGSNYCTPKYQMIEIK